MISRVALRENLASAWAAVLRGFSTGAASSRFNRLMVVIVGSLLVFDIVLAGFLRLNGLKELEAVVQLFVGSPGMLILIGACWYCRWRGEGLHRMGDVAQLAAWTLLVIPAISFLIPVAGRSPYPLVDGGLAKIDAALHFHTVTYVHLVAGLPRVRHALAIAYNFLPPIIVAAMVVPPLCAKALDSRRYMFAVLIVAVVTSALFALWPAAGPWTVEGFAPSKDQSVVVESLAFFKSGQPMPDRLKDSGVVAFPSFHVILAVLSVVALWRIRWVKWFALAIGILISISTITTGWHYGIDVLAGLAVAFLAQVIANRIVEPVRVPAAPDIVRDAQVPDGVTSRAQKSSQATTSN